jgi:disulfide oxidoreductase YuzD
LEKLSGRELELWRPILTLALFFNRYIDGLYEKMVDFAVRKSQEKLTENVTETAEYILATTLTELVKADDYYKVKDIRELMASKYSEEQKWLSDKWVGNALRRLGFMEKRRVGRGVEYLLKVAQVRDLAERLGIKNEEENEAVVIDMQTWIKAVYESFRKRYKESFNNVEFHHWFVDVFGVPKEEATSFLKQLASDNLIFSTYEGVWVWT